MNRKSGLGKGLSALIPSEYGDQHTEEAAGALTRVPVGAITPNPRQPRQRFDEEELAGLTASIRELGVLQPILVRVVDGGQFELIAGERRLRAAKRAGLPTVPVVIRDAGDDEAMLEQALVENLHRTDLNAMEEAAAYQQLIEDFGMTQEAVAQRVGKSRTAVTNTLRLFQLPPSIQAMVADGRVSAGHARALLGTPDRAYQEALAKRVVRDGLSVRETEEAVRARSGGPSDEPAPTKARPAPREPGLLELERLLSDHLDTRVSVSMGSRTGKVVVTFADLVDLERIYRLMLGG